MTATRKRAPAVDSVFLDEDEIELLTADEQAAYLEAMEQLLGPSWDLAPKQLYAEALWAKCDWLLFGGAAGGGKSDLALHHANRLSLDHPGHHALLLRQSIPELRRSLIVRLLARIKRFGIPARYRKVDGMVSFQYENGSIIECGHCRTDEDVAKYLSAEYDLIIVDEATTLSETQILQLQARLRTTKEKAATGIRPHLGLFTNPGGQSHAWMYDMMVTPTGYGRLIVVFDVSQGFDKAWPVRTYEAPTDPRTATFDELYDVLIPWVENLVIERDPMTQLVVGFVPSKATDNPHIDPTYLRNLNALPERRRRQLKDGDWDVFEGQFFDSYVRSTHAIDPFPIPRGWQRARGIDFGTTAPYCCLWGAWDEDGNCYIYREDYKAELTPAEQARRVLAASTSVDERGDQFREEFTATVADPSVFADRRGMGKSIADMWRDVGLQVSRAKNQRVAGWANVRQYLWDSEMDKPRLFIFNTCTNLLRTLPLMRHDDSNGEDLNTKDEDHAVDAVRYLLMVRPAEVRQFRRPDKPVGLQARVDEMMRRAAERGRRRTRGVPA